MSRSGLCTSCFSKARGGAELASHIQPRKKKSKQRGIATPKQDIDLIKERLKKAKQHHQDNYS